MSNGTTIFLHNTIKDWYNGIYWELVSTFIFFLLFYKAQVHLFQNYRTTKGVQAITSDRVTIDEFDTFELRESIYAD